MFAFMKVHCPIPGCSWNHDIVVKGNNEEDILALVLKIVADCKKQRFTIQKCVAEDEHSSGETKVNTAGDETSDNGKTTSTTNTSTSTGITAATTATICCRRCCRHHRAHPPILTLSFFRAKRPGWRGSKLSRRERQPLKSGRSKHARARLKR